MKGRDRKDGIGRSVSIVSDRFGSALSRACFYAHCPGNTVISYTYDGRLARTFAYRRNRYGANLPTEFE